MGDEFEINPWYGNFPYTDFIKSEGIPIHEAYSVDCHTVQVEPWERMGGLGAYVHLAGRSDYLSSYVVEIPPGGQLNPEQHMHDELIHVISGRGATVIETPEGKKYSFEWGPTAIFGIPMNAKHQIFNGSGTEPARLAAVTDLPIIFNVFRNPDFIFDNPFTFPERSDVSRYFDGEGEFREVKPGRHQWETNFVPELVNFELPPWAARGAAGNNIQFLLADSSMHCHISEFQQGTYKKAHRHNAGAHIFCVTGEGYSLLWREGENPVDTVRVDWKPGSLYAPPDGPTYHQHFNVADGPSRYLVFGFGGARYPVLESKMVGYENMDKSTKDGGHQIEYTDEDPRVLDLYESELAKRGLNSKMREFVGYTGLTPLPRGEVAAQRRVRVNQWQAWAASCRLTPVPNTSNGALLMGDEVEFNPYYGVFPYRDFLKEENIPVFEGYAVDCHTVPVEPWERLGGLGTYVHVAGKSDYLSAYVVEIPPGGELNQEQHMHDELIHVISGRGSTVIERPDGRRYSFEWGPSAIFAIPLNAKHQIFNGSGTEPARLAAVTDLPIIFNVFRNPDFIFDNPFTFPERMAAEKYFDGEGEFRQVKPGRHQWETNFVPELVNFELPPWVARGAAGNNIQFLLGDSSMHCHISQFFEGTYKKAHAHNAGAHIFCVTGEGYSLLWKEGENPVDTVRVDWKPGTLYAPPDGPTYHQHFNVSPGQSRYLVFDFGGARYPVLESKMWNYENMDKSEKAGGMQIEYEDEDPRIHALFESELSKRGLKSRMHEFIPARA